MTDQTRSKKYVEDKYFNPGNRLLKIKEGFITLVGWALVMGLMTVVLTSSMSAKKLHLPKILPQMSGFYDIDHLATILATLSIISFLICIFFNHYE
ncbi:hypothetical protein [Companilactobacillus furfuricola]|uniref:hypothetical protein n=1 Tax=Companilactobacillus furfuricola TaxID=1462575 RepID=UPI000F79189D|nr:hypothetical protein [Companilactobacillus furfuricola]